jgi:cytochrome b561
MHACLSTAEQSKVKYTVSHTVRTACMHVCIYACMHVCMYACMHLCMYAFMHVCMRVLAQHSTAEQGTVYSKAQVQTAKCAQHVCMYACVFVEHSTHKKYSRSNSTRSLHVCMRVQNTAQQSKVQYTVSKTVRTACMHLCMYAFMHVCMRVLAQDSRTRYSIQ